MKKSSSTGSLTSLATLHKVTPSVPPCSPVAMVVGNRRSSSCCAFDGFSAASVIASSMLSSMDTIAKEIVLETQLESVLHVPSHVAGMCLLEKPPHVFPSNIMSEDTTEDYYAKDVAMCLATPPDPPEKCHIVNIGKGERNMERFSELLALRKKRKAGRRT